jgi:hypothetical protein
VAPHAIHRNTEQLGIVVLKDGQDFVVQNYLIAADRAPVGRVKDEYHRLSAKVTQRDRLVWITWECEFGRWRTWCQRGLIFFVGIPNHLLKLAFFVVFSPPSDCFG